MSESNISLPPVRPPAQLDLFLLSYVDFSAALALQQLFAQEVRSNNRHRAAVLLCEHPPCYSRGTGQLKDFAAEQATREAGLACYSAPHTSELIHHGPGQLAIYPVLSLAQMELSPFGYRNALETLLANMCEDLGAPEVEIESGTGIRCRGGLVVRTAVHIRDDISQLGAYLNVSRLYNLGAGEKATTLAAASRRSPQVSQVKGEFIAQLERWFGSVESHVFTRHPLLQRKTIQTDEPDDSD